MPLDPAKSGAVILPADSKNNVVLIHAWDFTNVDPADDNIIVEVQCIDGKAEFRILGSIDEEVFPGSGFGPIGEWGIVHAERRLTTSAGESFSETYTKHPFMVVVADNPTPNPVTVQAIMYGRDSLGDPSLLPPEVVGHWGNSSAPQVNTLKTTGISVDSTCDYFCAIANEDDRSTSSVTGMGLSWSKLDERHNPANVRTSIWYGSGAASGLGEVTANFTGSGSASSTAMMVFAMKRVDNTSPAFDSSRAHGGGTSVTTPTATTDNNGAFLGIVGEDNNVTLTPTVGSTLVAKYGVGSDVAIHVTIFKPTLGVARGLSANLSSSADWAAIALSLRRS